MSKAPHAWYKNPWVWLIIALPASAVIAGIATVIITSMNQPEMVVDDYYKEGKAINQKLTLMNRAKELGIELDIRVSDKRVEIKGNQEFPALKAQFIHSTLSEKDFNMVLTPNAMGSLSSRLENPVDGKWQIIVAPMDESWKLKKNLAFPTSGWVKF